VDAFDRLPAAVDANTIRDVRFVNNTLWRRASYHSNHYPWPLFGLPALQHLELVHNDDHIGVLMAPASDSEGTAEPINCTLRGRFCTDNVRRS